MSLTTKYPAKAHNDSEIELMSIEWNKLAAAECGLQGWLSPGAGRDSELVLNDKKMSLRRSPGTVDINSPIQAIRRPYINKKINYPWISPEK